MLKVSVKVFKNLYLMNTWLNIVDNLPDVRYWSEVLCVIILTHISALEIKVTDFEILCLSFWLKVLEVNKFLEVRRSPEPYLSPVKRICVFEHSVMTNFNCACPDIQRGQGSGFHV